MDKRIQIPQELYNLMVSYIRDHYDDTDYDRYARIEQGVREKANAISRRMMYSIYKSDTASKEEKETARQMYLNEIGMRIDFRW